MDTLPLSDSCQSDTPAHRDLSVGFRGRWILAAWSLLLMAGFVLARSLDPDPRGFGTHQRLGLPPCTFRAVFGISCPGCGMTTSFSHYVRGSMAESVRTNPAGFALALVCTAMIPWCWLSLAKGRLLGVTDADRAILLLVVGVFALSLIQWSVRLFVG